MGRQRVRMYACPGLDRMPFQASIRGDSGPFSGNPEMDLARKTIDLVSI